MGADECYAPVSPDDDFLQGELLSAVSTYSVSGESSPPRITVVELGFAVVLSQSCDLVTRDVGKQVPEIEVLLCQAQLESACISFLPQGPVLRIIRQNTHPRFHYLRAFDPDDDSDGVGSNEPMYIDFRSIFTLSMTELRRQAKITALHRRCSLLSPFREHLSSRFGDYISRVALPSDHFPAVKLSLAANSS